MSRLSQIPQGWLWWTPENSFLRCVRYFFAWTFPIRNRYWRNYIAIWSQKRAFLMSRDGFVMYISWSNLRWDGICLIIWWIFLSVRYRRLRVVGLPPNFQRFEAHVWKCFFCGFLLPSSSGSLFSRGGLEVTGGSEKCKNPKSHHKLLHEFFRCPLHNGNVFYYT